MQLRTLLLALICIFAGASALVAQQTETKAKDSIRILEVTSSTPVRDGVENEFTVKIEYDLQSSDEATASIGFNSDDPGRYRITGRKKVAGGTNVLMLKGVIAPKDWKDRGDFIVYVNLSPYPAGQSRFRPYATAEKVIDFEP
jgi:hypothetical protein